MNPSLRPLRRSFRGGTVTGTVTNPQGECVQGAEVRLAGTATTATTDRSGRYHIRTVGADQLNDAWFDNLKTVDASVRYTFRHRLSLYLEGKNPTEQVTRRIFSGRSDRPSEHEKPAGAPEL